MSAIRARIWRYRAKWKSQGFCRYFGVTTSFDSDFDAVKAMVRRQKPDFLQVNYSLAHRAAEKRHRGTGFRRGLKYLLGNPAVTAAIPGTSNPEHMADNLWAGSGRLPDAAQRQRMVAFFEALR